MAKQEKTKKTDNKLSPTVCVCVLRERTVSFPRPAYPKIHPSVLQTVCVRIFRFMIGLFSLFCLILVFFFFFFFFADAPTINQNKKVSKDYFSIISFKNSV